MPDHRPPDPLSAEVRERARRLAFGAYHRAGRLGRRVLGPDPATSPTEATGPDVDVPPWTPLPYGVRAGRAPVRRGRGEMVERRW